MTFCTFCRTQAIRIAGDNTAAIHYYERASVMPMVGPEICHVGVVLLLLLLIPPHSVVADFTLGTRQSPFLCGLNGNMFCTAETQSSSSEGALELIVNRHNHTDEYNQTHATALCTKHPLPLTKPARSFRTNFTFRIEPGPTGPGEGMVFLIQNALEWTGGEGPGFGVYDVDGRQEKSTLTVEFDTRQSKRFSDISDNHVGINLETVVSKVSRNAGEVDITLASNRSISAWIDYDAVLQELEVRISSSRRKPMKAFLSYSVDLSSVFGLNTALLYAGFSGSSGMCNCYSFYLISDWNFELLPPSASTLPSSKDSPFEASTSFLDSEGKSFALVGGVIAVTFTVLMLFFGLILYFYLNSRSSRKLNVNPNELNLVGMSENLKFSYKQLSAATGQFSEEAKLGRRGLGCVYRGVLPSSGQHIAVKKVGVNSKNATGEFMAEVSVISELRHRNIVRLLGWCSESHQLLLVYELMPNGSLDMVLFESGPYAGTGLSWEYRFRIVLGMASSVRHLHEGFRQQVVHRCIKSSNIMLDDEFNAMLGDFGLVGVGGFHKDPSTTAMGGSSGYVAPELRVSQAHDAKTDVYAFGAVALEVVCGRKAYDLGLPGDEKVLVDWVWSRLSEQTLLSVVDCKLDVEYDRRQVQDVLMVGLLCSHPNPADRPSMQVVMEMLSGNTPIPPVPPSKPIVAYKKIRGQLRVEDSKQVCSLTSGQII